MPDVQTTLEYLQRLPLYDEEKPYWCFLPPHEGFDPDKQRVDNLEWENHSGITITDIRKNKGHYRLDDNGFQVMNHDSKFTKFENLSDIDNYKLETENLLKETMNAVYVKCYDTRLRKNILFRRTEFDLNDPLTSEGPARGAHNGKLSICTQVDTMLMIVQISPITRDPWLSIATPPMKLKLSIFNQAIGLE